jgi:YD repeat-containing protein
LEFNLSPEILELDYAAGSIGVDLRGEFPVTRVELTPDSPVHRVKPRHLMVYVSNDNSSYTEVKDWEAATGAGGKMVITFATPVTTRFIKVQCQFDDRDREYRPVNRAEFKHKPEELIKVYYTVTSRYEEYAYDASGNRVQERITLRMTETRNYSYYPNSSRLRTNGVYGFVYDANGNLIRKGTSYTVTGNGIELKEEGEYWEYRYDLLNRLTEVKKNGATVARYWYDETGLRVKKESGNGTIYYVFNQEGQVLYEEENQGYVEYIYLLGRHFARVDAI